MNNIRIMILRELNLILDLKLENIIIEMLIVIKIYELDYIG